MRWKSLLLSLLVGSASPSGAQNQPGLKDLRSLEQFTAVFNRDHGRPRLILLLSPT